MRIAILQRVVKSYRLPVYHELSKSNEVVFFYGDDIAGTKSVSCNIENINANKSRTSHISVFGKTFTLHWDLIRALKDYNPDAILVEGESHFFGSLQARFYGSFINRSTAIVKWCFIDLPGAERTGFRFIVKLIFQRLFDTYAVYSSFSKKALARYGIKPDRIFVATNVSDTDHLLATYSRDYKESNLAKSELGLANLFTVLFVGNLEKQKKFERFLEVAQCLHDYPIQFLVAGGGGNLDKYLKLASTLKLENVTFLGQVENPSSAYFASDILYIPGRGGMVISEAMCFALPVLAHSADGTEYDLILDGETGFRLIDDLTIVAEKIKSLSNDSEFCERMGKNGHNLIRNTYNTKNMAEKILEAIYFART